MTKDSDPTLFCSKAVEQALDITVNEATPGLQLRLLSRPLMRSLVFNMSSSGLGSLLSISLISWKSNGADALTTVS